MRRSLILLLQAFSLAHALDGYPSRTRWTDMQQWIRYCRSRSKILVRLLKEVKSQVQPERGSCERSCSAVPWSTHIVAKLLHETKLLFEPTIVVLVLASIAL